MTNAFTPLFIDGTSRPSSTNARYDVRNPFSQAVIGHAAAASSEDCKTYSSKASELLTTPKYQAKISKALKEELAFTDFMVGFELMASVYNLRHNAAVVHQLKEEVQPSLIPGAQMMIQKRTMGVILALAPWNVPLALAFRAVSIPIICGNTVVLKCSAVSPRIQSLVGEIFQEVGLPKGVLNTISIAEEDISKCMAEMIAHPAVRKINFTGGPNVGRAIAMEAAKHLKPCVLELSGNCPVLEDADLEAAAQAITTGGLMNTSQICMSTQRVIVQRGALSSLTSSLVESFGSLKAGGTGKALSSLVSEESAERVLKMIREARDTGARILVGDITRQISVVQPHLLSDVKPGMALWDEECFGPVVTLTAVDTIDEAVQLANTSDYSLMAALWTQNLHTALEVAPRIRAGYININGQSVHGEGAMGGIGGLSGYGRFTISNFTDDRVLLLHPQKSPVYAIAGAV
ncbi:aldehyde dehydrogenase [Laetiporus sulphureus 93-53]|uniref:Aldehyde dehydrogenase n=1 Tax=Laetiporus sulphureus 93-53 TaxID=1314785 RepID=A0A165DG22_9APHY|nr:aldehyde dehydrogenase [Laetiporus sulphureus 93-53]KZT04813.1 aldehyde dehydrogenase [Laetiporus sulphureus 93-53]